jgi:hypothetical protein
VTWFGWLWVDGWERVCSAPTIGECARELGRIGEQRGVPTWLQVLTGGAPPSLTPRTRRTVEASPESPGAVGEALGPSCATDGP